MVTAKWVDTASSMSNLLCYNNTRIGRYVSLGRNCEIGPAQHPTDFLSTHGFQYNKALFPNVQDYCFERQVRHLSHKQTSIGNDVWIGAKAVVKAGVTIGDGAIIGSCAFVSKDVPPYAIVAGVPATLLRYRFDDDVIAALLDLKWWDLPLAYLQHVRFDDIHRAIADCHKAKEQWQKDDKA